MTIQGFFFSSHFHIKLPWRPLKYSTRTEEEKIFMLVAMQPEVLLNGGLTYSGVWILRKEIWQKLDPPINGMRPTSEC